MLAVLHRGGCWITSARDGEHSERILLITGSVRSTGLGFEHRFFPKFSLFFHKVLRINSHLKDVGIILISIASYHDSISRFTTYGVYSARLKYLRSKRTNLGVMDLTSGILLIAVRIHLHLSRRLARI